MKPRLTIGVSGISDRTKSVLAIMKQIREEGTKPVFIDYAVTHPARAADATIDSIDALVVMGNDLDIDPKLYIDRYAKDDPKRRIHPQTNSELGNSRSAARARYEEALLEKALSNGMPILAVCGGMQRLNVMLGGTLHQHIPDLVGCNKHMQHKQGIAPNVPVIPIIIKDNTTLATIGCNIKTPFSTDHSACVPKVIMENSMHHQALDRIGRGLRVCAMTDTIKRERGATGFMAMAVESDPDGLFAQQFILGVQWHPEFGASSLGEDIVHHLTLAARRFAHLRATKRTRLRPVFTSSQTIRDIEDWDI